MLPLAIYLLTFVLAFQSRLPLPMWLLLPVQLAAVIFACSALVMVAAIYVVVRLIVWAVR